MIDLDKLHHFILTAKAASYVGDGEPAPSCRHASHDLAYQDGDYRYHDSYFGGADFIGEEVVYHQGNPVWGMNYYGKVLKLDRITPETVGRMIKDSLSLMYHEGRFLGGWSHAQADLTYQDASQGDLTHFSGHEWIEKDDEVVYDLVYHGGLIR